MDWNCDIDQYHTGSTCRHGGYIPRDHILTIGDILAKCHSATGKNHAKIVLPYLIYLDCRLSKVIPYSECPKKDGVIRSPFLMTDTSDLGKKEN